LFVSGYAEVEIPKEGLMSTARLLPKPFTMKELLTTLSEIMEDGKRSEAKLPTAR
jgi:DNA-binding response OmpR family regulator